MRNTEVQLPPNPPRVVFVYHMGGIHFDKFVYRVYTTQMKQKIITEFYGGNYSAREDGQIIYNKTGKIKIQRKLNKDYMGISIDYKGKKSKAYVHRLIAKTFIPCENQSLQVNHIDGDKTNNHVSNLEWVTLESNLEHAFQNNLIHLAKLSREEVLDLLEETNTFTERMGEKYNVGKGTIRSILEKPGLTYRHFSKKD